MGVLVSAGDTVEVCDGDFRDWESLLHPANMKRIAGNRHMKMQLYFIDAIRTYPPETESTIDDNFISLSSQNSTGLMKIQDI